jgi:hypothetical protein
MKKKPTDFKITGQSGVTVFEEDLFAPVEPKLIKVITEYVDYKKTTKVTLLFSRRSPLTSQSAMKDKSKLREYVVFNEWETGEVVIEKLRALADRLAKEL